MTTAKKMSSTKKKERNPRPAEEAEWEPEEWLASIETDSKTQPVEHGPGDRYERAGVPDYHEQIMQGRADRVAAHRVVSSLALLRREVGMTQVQVAADWGTTQPAVSRFEADPGRAEVGSLLSYVTALGGHLYVDVEIAGEHYRVEFT